MRQICLQMIVIISYPKKLPIVLFKKMIKRNMIIVVIDMKMEENLALEIRKILMNLVRVYMKKLMALYMIAKSQNLLLHKVKIVNLYHLRNLLIVNFLIMKKVNMIIAAIWKIVVKNLVMRKLKNLMKPAWNFLMHMQLKKMSLFAMAIIMVVVL